LRGRGAVGKNDVLQGQLRIGVRDGGAEARNEQDEGKAEEAAPKEHVEREKTGATVAGG
jgi:hypothetical protein